MNSLPISTVITSKALPRSDKQTKRFALFKSLQTSIIQVSKSSCLLVFCLLVCCQSNSQTCKNNQDTVGAAMLHLWCGYAALLVYLCWTVGIPILNLWYTYTEPLVYLCWTFGTRMLYSSGTVFSICLQAISRRESEWRMKKRSSAAGGKANEELSAVGRLRNKVRRPNFVS